MPKEPDSLFSIRQWDEKSLKDYVARFKSAILEIYDLDEHVAMLASKRGLRSSKFTYSIYKTYPRSYLELLTCAQKYIWVEEVVVVQQETDGKPRRKKPWEDPSNNQVEKPTTSHPRSLKLRKPKYPDYTPLLAPRMNILMKIEGEKFLQWPPPMKSPPTS